MDTKLKEFCPAEYFSGMKKWMLTSIAEEIKNGTFDRGGSLYLGCGLPRSEVAELTPILKNELQKRNIINQIG